MKRICLVFAILILMVGNVFAARSAVFSSKTADEYGNRVFIEITAAITCHTDGTFAAIGLYMNEEDEAAGKLADLSGYFLHSISVYFGTAAPKADSDITLLEHTSSGKDILVGAGTDMLDAATNNYFTTLIGTIPHPVPVFGPLYLVISNNDVNPSTSTLVFKFVRGN